MGKGVWVGVRRVPEGVGVLVGVGLAVGDEVGVALGVAVGEGVGVVVDVGADVDVAGPRVAVGVSLGVAEFVSSTSAAAAASPTAGGNEPRLLQDSKQADKSSRGQNPNMRHSLLAALRVPLRCVLEAVEPIAQPIRSR